MAVGLDTLLNCDANVEGPAVTDHAPVPVEGVFPASVTELVVVQMLWSDPATAVVGVPETVTLALPVVDVPHQFLTVTE